MKTRILLNSVLTVALLIATVTFAAAGQYDGLWQSPSLESGYVLVRHNDASLLAVVFTLNGESEIYLGTQSGNGGQLLDLNLNDYDVVFDYSFPNSSQWVLTVVSCSGDCEGVPDPGETITFTKIY